MARFLNYRESMRERGTDESMAFSSRRVCKFKITSLCQVIGFNADLIFRKHSLF